MDIGDLGYPVRARFGGQTTPVKSARLALGSSSPKNLTGQAEDGGLTDGRWKTASLGRWTNKGHEVGKLKAGIRKEKNRKESERA
jgi:hypothetical protein